MRNCKICTLENCDCLCDTCLRTRVIMSIPEYLYEASEYTRSQWIENQLVKAKVGE